MDARHTNIHKFAYGCGHTASDGKNPVKFDRCWSPGLRSQMSFQFCSPAFLWSKNESLPHFAAPFHEGA